MIPNSRAFNGKSWFEHDGKTFLRWYTIDKEGIFKLKINVIATKSAHKQGIALFFSNFKGKLHLNGKNLPVLKGKFKHYVFDEDTIPGDGLILSVHAEAGHLVLGNGSRTPGDGGFECGAFGCAFWIETLAENKFRFHCNDHEMDDDFDDLIFDLEIEDNEE